MGNGHMHMTKLPECHTKSICGSQEKASAPLCYPVHLALIISVLADTWARLSVGGYPDLSDNLVSDPNGSVIRAS